MPTTQEFTYKGNFDISGIIQSVNDAQKVLNSLNLPSKLKSQITDTIKSFTTASGNANSLLSGDIDNTKDFNKLLNYSEEVRKAFKNLTKEANTMGQMTNKSLQQMIPQSLKNKVDQVNTSYQNFIKTQEAVVSKTQAVNDANDKIAKTQAKLNNLQQRQTIPQIDYNKYTQATSAAKNAVKQLDDEVNQLKKDIEAANAAGDSALATTKTQELSTKISELKQATDALDAAQKQQAQYIGETTKKSMETKGNNYLATYKQELNNATAELAKATAARDAARVNLNNEAQSVLNTDLTKVADSDLNEALNQGIDTTFKQAIIDVKNAIQQLIATLQAGQPEVDQLEQNIKDGHQAVADFDQQLKDEQAIKSRVKAFFSMNTALSMIRRSLRNAFNTVKELDAVMAETAVVTNFSVGDMWNQLPEYTDRANQLGVSIKDVYKASTLYYQQGLKTNEVQAVANETLKMARIAGLDAADATNKMTAALRGFNMEINEQSAQRISDVYSKLAAITASDVNEISSAMTKTASLASNAGMEFETTAAFLSQIIETTRESAETAGTALKTVIARFQELKKSPGEIMEVEGETVDANKIEGALRTVGVALRDTTGQFRNLDEVFLELSSKWDSLDTNTQRYIATIAAGSRQQSRFIAMMSDYARTNELVTAANNAAGASAQQYNKTLESLETKLNQLKNAWDEFTLGIADSKVIKFAVDSLKTIITLINKVTGVLGTNIGGFAKLGVVIGALKGGGKIFDAYSKNLASMKAPAAALNKTLKDTGAALKVIAAQPFQKATWISGENITTLYAWGEGLRKGATNIAQLTSGMANAADIQVAYNWALQQGVSEEVAIQMALNEKSRALIIEEATQKQSTQETIKNTMAEATNLAIKKQGILTKLKDYALLLFGNKETRKAVALKYGLATADAAGTVAAKGATAAQTAYNAALLACPIGWIVAAVAALAVAIVGVVHIIQSHNYTIEEINESMTALNDTIAETKEEIDKLSDTENNLDELNEKFDNLLIGSQEWRDTLREINTIILDLITQYPELIENGFISSNNGKLEISKEGLEAINREQEEKLFNEQSSLIALQGQKALKENENIIKEIKNQVPESDRQITEQEFYKKVVEGVSEEELRNYWEKNLKVTGGFKTYDEFTKKDPIYAKASKAALEYAKNLETESEAGELYGQQLIAHQFPNIDQGVADILAEAYDERTVLKLQKAQEDEYTNFKMKNDENALNFLMEYFGVDTKSEARKAYRKSTKDEKNTIREQASNYFYAKEQNEILTARQDSIKKLVSEDQKALQKITTKNGELLRQEDIKALASKLQIKDFVNATEKDFANAFKGTFGIDLAEDLGLKVSEVLDNIINVDDSFKKIEAKLNRRDIDSSFIKQMGYGEANTLAGKLIGIRTTASTAELNSLSTQISDLYSQLGDYSSVFMTELNSMDWSDLSSWEDLKDNLLEAGIVLDKNTNNSLKQFIANAIDASDATKKIDLSKITEIARGGLGVLNNLKTGKQNLIFDDSTYKSLMEASSNRLAKYFTQSVDGSYVYLGNSMQELQKAIEANTAATLEQGAKELKAQVKAGELLNNNSVAQNLLGALKQGRYNIRQRGGQSGNRLEELLKLIQNEIGDLSLLQIAGLSNDTLVNFSDFSNNEEDQQKLFDEIYEKVYENYNTNKINYDKLTSGDIYTASYMLNNAVDNSLKLTELRGAKDALDVATIEDYTAALIAQARLLGINEIEIGKYTELSKKFTETQDEGVIPQLEEFEKLVANASSMVNGNEQLAIMVENIQKLAEGFVDLDPKAQAEKMKEMAAAFQIDSEEFNDDATLANLLIAFSNGDYGAYKELIKISGKQNGSKFRSKLAELGLMRVVELDNGAKQTRNLTEDEFQSMFDLNMDDKAWENPYDWLFNMGEEINAQIRERNKLEREYNLLILKDQKNATEIADIYKVQADTLQHEIELNRNKQSMAQQEIDAMLANSEFADYVDAQALARGQILIDETKTKALEYNPEQGEKLTEWIEKLQKWIDTRAEAEEAIDEVVETLYEIRDLGKEEYLNLEESVLKGILDEKNAEIDALENINSAIEDSNGKLIDSIKTTIDKERQDRENAKTETEISDKERRLVYLSMDTSGANALEVAQLQKEIEENKQSYEDSIIDQAIQKLEDDNQKASDQRSEQIAIMRAQLDYWEKNGYFYDASQTGMSSVGSIISTGLDAEGQVIKDSLLEKYLRLDADYAAMSDLQKQEFTKELSQNSALAYTYLNRSVFDKASGYINGVVAPINTNSAAISANTVDIYYDKNNINATHYATGGLNTHTGPAWLDGTPSAPELVLNAQDTQNFLALRDVLSSVNGNSGLGLNGDNYYDISIDVDQLSSDYDVEQLARKIKSMISDDANYRNVNLINRLR